jgi:type II secretory pathway predicted ATPase ExeA
MINLIHKSLLNYFGLSSLGLYHNKTFIDFRDDIVDAIVNNQMLLIPGEFGSGKTFLFEAAEQYLKNGNKFVRVVNLDVEKCTISSIINACIYELSAEGPKRDLEARSRQFVRIVGKEHVEKGTNICIVIEDAHLLNKHTFKALKTLREARFAGVWPLFSVVLIGQWEMMEKVSKRKEVSWRTCKVSLDEESGWMTFEERVAFLRLVFGEAISAPARRTIALVNKQPLQMIQYVRDKMKDAKKVGYKQIDTDVVNPTLKELYDASGMSTRDIEKKTGIPNSTVYTAINSGIKDEQKIKQIRELLLSAVNGKPACRTGRQEQQNLFKKVS